MADLTQSSIRGQTVTPPEKFEDSNESYLVHGHWTVSGDLMTLWFARSQNHSVIATCSQGNNWKCDKKISLDSNIPTVSDLAVSLLPDTISDVSFLRFPRPDSAAGTFFNIGVFGANVSHNTHVNYLLE